MKERTAKEIELRDHLIERVLAEIPYCRLNGHRTCLLYTSGVDKSFAIQAGREIRVMVVQEQVSDADMVLMARNISKQIEFELEYPGPVSYTHLELRQKKGMTEEQARELLLTNYLYYGVMMVKMGDADGMVSGALSLIHI